MAIKEKKTKKEIYGSSSTGASVKKCPPLPFLCHRHRDEFDAPPHVMLQTALFVASREEGLMLVTLQK
jgi:hypothetical protein